MRYLAVLLTALALVAPGAHLLALPNKIALPAEAYLAAQRAYDGWAWLGALPVAAILANVGVARRRRLAWLAALLLAVGLAVFFAWTFPANRATASWTILPEDWQALRRDREWSHAANALLGLAALLVALRAALSAPDAAGAGYRG